MLSWMRGSIGTVNAASQLFPHALKLSMGYTFAIAIRCRQLPALQWTVNGLGRQLRIGDSRHCFA
jgi:hypothetical protein